MHEIDRDSAIYCFGPFEVDRQTGELRKRGIKLKLQDQPLQILFLLLDHAGQMVSREDIRRGLWPDDTFVDFDHAINNGIRRLRDTFGDSPDTPRFIETLARRGYRFIAPVSRTLYTSRPQALLPVETEISPARITSPASASRARLYWWTGCVAVLVVAASLVGVRWRAAQSVRTRGDVFPLAVPLTGNPGYEEFPTFSPEGTRVAFSWTPATKTSSNIYLKLLGPGDPIRLTNSPTGFDFAPAWSPDGRTIAFLRARDPLHSSVTLVPSLGGRERQLAEITFEANDILNHGVSYEISPPFLAWSTDGRWLITAERRAPSESSSIIRISLQTGEKRTLTFPPEHMTGDGGIALSPDGKKLAFVRGLDFYISDIYEVPLSRDMLPLAEPKRLTFDRKEIAGIAWTADGRSLVFCSNRAGRRELWQMTAAPSGKPSRLIAASDDPREVAISRGAQHVAYSHQSADWNIWRLNLSKQGKDKASSLIVSTRLDYHPNYSPDGRSIAFESNRSGNEEVWISYADGSHPAQLTNSHNSWAGSPRWSPDGQKIAFDSNAAGSWDVYVIRSQGGQPKRVTMGGANEFKPNWSRDGSWIYYCSTRTGHSQIWKIPAAGGAEVQVTKAGGIVPVESADGAELYYIKDGNLWKTAVQGGIENKVLDSVLLSNFALTKLGIYFVERPQESREASRLKLWDFRSKAIRIIANLPGPVGDGIDISPDAGSVLWSKSDHEGSELMIIEHFH